MFLRPFARTPLVIVERNSNLGTVTVKDWTARKLSKFGLATFSESYFKTEYEGLMFNQPCNQHVYFDRLRII